MACHAASGISITSRRPIFRKWRVCMARSRRPLPKQTFKAPGARSTRCSTTSRNSPARRWWNSERTATLVCDVSRLPQPRAHDNGAAASLASRAYRLLEEAIVTQQIAPGSAVPEAHLSELIRMGRMPTREAVRRLSLENLVEVCPSAAFPFDPSILTHNCEIGRAHV